MNVSDTDMGMEWVPALQVWRITATHDGVQLSQHFLPGEAEGWTPMHWAVRQHELASRLRRKLGERREAEHKQRVAFHRERLAECGEAAEAA